MIFTNRSLLTVFALTMLAAPLPAADLIATDQENVYKFDLVTGAKTVINTVPGEFYTDVTADKVGGIFVNSNNNGNILGFTDTGAPLPGFTTIIPPANYISEGITFNRNTNQLTTANGNNVSTPGQIYATSGASVGTTAFNLPVKSWALVYDSSDNLYNTANNSGVVSKNGAPFITTPGALPQAQYLAADTSGLYVSAKNIGANSFVLKYDFAGNPDPNFTTITAGQTSNLYGLTVHDGVLYVVNRNTISKYNSTTGALIQADWVMGNSSTATKYYFRGITISNVPEPSTYALAAIASGILAVIARRRKARAAKPGV